MANSRNLDDIELTDFDSDSIFVTHPKTRRNSSESRHTFETYLGDSTPSIGTQSVSENQITDNVEQESDSNPPPTYDQEGMYCLENLNIYSGPSNHVIIDIDEEGQEPASIGHATMDNNELEEEPELGLPTNEPETVGNQNKTDVNLGLSFILAQIILLSRSTQNLWNQMKTYCYLDLKESFNWTILQTWYNLAFFQGVVPFYISQSAESEQFRRYSCRPQQLMWLVSKLILILDTIGWIPLLIQGLEMEPTPYTYLNMGGFLAVFLLRCVFLRLSTCDTELFVEYINKNLNSLGRMHENHPWYIQSRSVTFASFFLWLILNITALSLELCKYTLSMGDMPSWTLKDIVSVYACYGKQILLWADAGNCIVDEQKISEVHAEAIAFSVFGLAAYINAVISQAHISMLLLSGSSSLLLDVIVVRNLEALNALDKFNVLKERAARLSNIIGTLMIVYMAYFAISMPGWLELAFSTNVVMLLSLLFDFLLMLAFSFGGCLASHYMDRIKSEMIQPDGVEPVPVDMRQLTSLLHKFFQNSVGISFYDLVVLNFRLIFSYVCIISSFVVVIHESMKDDKTHSYYSESSDSSALLKLANVTSS